MKSGFFKLVEADNEDIEIKKDQIIIGNDKNLSQQITLKELVDKMYDELLLYTIPEPTHDNIIIGNAEGKYERLSITDIISRVNSGTYHAVIPPPEHDNFLIGTSDGQYLQISLKDLIDKLSSLHSENTNSANSLLKLNENGKIDKNQIETDSIEQDKISDNAVTTNKIADNAVNTAKILDNAVTINKIKKDEAFKIGIDNLLKLEEKLLNKVDKVESKVLSDNNFTDSLLQKVNSMWGSLGAGSQTTLHHSTFNSTYDKNFYLSQDYYTIITHYSSICFVFETSVHNSSIFLTTSNLALNTSYEIGKYNDRYVILKTPTSSSSTMWNVYSGNVSLQGIKAIAI